MRILCVLLTASLAASFVCLASAQDTSNLPSAPSATLSQQQKQAAPPAQQPEQPSTQEQARPNNASGQPVIESLDPPKPQPKPAAEDSQPQVAAQQGNQHLESGAKASAPAESEQTPESTFRVPVNEVNVVFVVTDKHNHYVKGLQKDDFRVLDDKKPAASIRNFSTETNLPLRVGLLIDASNSIRDRFRFEQQAAIEFLNQIIHPERDQAFVLGFDTTPEITQDFTGNPEKLANGVRLLRPGGGTAMYDAIYGACRDKLAKTQSQQGGLRRAIILVSDGEDNQSRVTRDDAIEEAQRAEVIVYAISTNVTGTKTRGDKILEAITEATGGRAFFPFKIEEVADAFSQIQEELRSQYAISYKPADFLADGKYRSIDIEALNKKYKVRGRKGYFAPKAETASAAAAGR